LLRSLCLSGLLPSAHGIERNWIIVFSALAIAAFGLAFGAVRDAVARSSASACSLRLRTISFHACHAKLYPTRIRAMPIGSTGFSAFVIAFVLRDFGAAGVFG
jgi:hypothetical protein